MRKCTYCPAWEKRYYDLIGMVIVVQIVPRPSMPDPVPEGMGRAVNRHEAKNPSEGIDYHEILI